MVFCGDRLNGCLKYKGETDVTPFKTTHGCGVPEPITLVKSSHAWPGTLCTRQDQVVFIVLRDRSGLMQVTVDESCDPSVLEIKKSSFGIHIGSQRWWLRTAPNKTMETGEVELA